MSQKDKYLKYKTKYLQLKKYIQIGGFFPEPRLKDPTKAGQFNFWDFNRLNDKGEPVTNRFPYIDIGMIRFIVPYKFVLQEDPNRHVLCVQSFLKKTEDSDIIDDTKPPTLFMVYTSNSECNVWRYMSYTYDLEKEKDTEDPFNYVDIIESTNKKLIDNNDTIIKIETILAN